jgi:hypothetical protein
MATDGGNMGNGYGEEGGGRATASTMEMGMGTARKAAARATTRERGVMVAMGHGLCVFVCVWRDHKK